MTSRCRATAQDAILIHPEGVLEVVRAASVLSGGMLPTGSQLSRAEATPLSACATVLSYPAGHALPTRSEPG